jgi:hypothetical protein
MIRTYKLTQVYLQYLRKQYMTRVLPLFLVFPILVGLFSIFISSHINLYSIFIIIILLAIIYLFSRKQLIHEVNSWESFQILITEDSIIRKQDNMNEIIIPFRNISKIIELNKKILQIESGLDQQKITISHHLENYEEVKIILSQYHLIESIEKNDEYTRIKLILAILLIISSIGIVFYSRNIFLVFPSGILIIGIMVYEIIRNLKNENSTRKAKWFCLVYLIPIQIVLTKVYYLLKMK